jgi:hypothetical protein
LRNLRPEGNDMSVRMLKARLDKLEGSPGFQRHITITVHHEYPKELLDQFMAENGIDGPECFKLIIRRFGDEDIMAEPKILSR